MQPKAPTPAFSPSLRRCARSRNPHDKEGFIKALEGMELELPEDPVGSRSRINPETHQIIQMRAIGIVVRDARYPPATALLGNFEVYPAERLLPSRVEIAPLRGSGCG